VVFSEQRVHASEAPYYGSKPGGLEQHLQLVQPILGPSHGAGNIVFGDAHVANFKYGYVVGLVGGKITIRSAPTSTGPLTASESEREHAASNLCTTRAPSAGPVSKLVAEQGFVIVSGVLNKRECEELINLLGSANGAGRRGILELPQIARLACSERLLSSSGPICLQRLNRFGHLLRQSPETNWMVAWHQDLTLAVRNRIDLPGFGQWSVKQGVPHVQPPVDLLEQMLTIRLHLDDSDEANGALRLIPGSHQLGGFPPTQSIDYRMRTLHVCCVAAGDALLMKPLLLHSSARSHNESHRRVIHIEYAAFALPGGTPMA
jgi:hypothetical protein